MKEPYDDDLFDTSNVVSSTECTGLIQTPPLNEDEYRSYQELSSMQIPKKKKE